MTIPVIMEMIGSPDLFADGWVVRVEATMVEVIFYVIRRAGETIEHREVGRVHVPRQGYVASSLRVSGESVLQ